MEVRKMAKGAREDDESRLRSLLAELRERERRFLDVADNELEWFWEVDAEGRYTYASPTVEKILGHAPEELLGRHFFDLFHPEQRDELREAALKTFTRKTSFREFVNRNLHKDGHEVWLSTSGVPIVGDAGELLGYRGADTDITHRVRAEEEGARMARRIQEAQRMESLGLLAGGIAHDFNNLLVGVLGHVGMALKKVGADSPASYHLLGIENAARRAAELTGQLLAYSGRSRFALETVDLSRLVSEMKPLLGTAISVSACMQYELSPDPPTVRADPAQLRQIVMNLITNASDALGDRYGVITVTTGTQDLDEKTLEAIDLGWEPEAGRYVFVEVTDNGVGMSHDTQAQIFDPFFSTKSTGRGLGLAAVLGIVRGHGGAIRISSRPGRGTTFKVFLPAVKPEEEPSSDDDASTDEWRGKGLILVVDDEEAVRETTRFVLEECGFEVALAAGGEKAIEILSERRDNVSAVLLDMSMPQMSGRETHFELRRISPTTPVILTSGYHERDAVDQFGADDLAAFLQKPYDVDELIAVIRRVLEDA